MGFWLLVPFLLIRFGLMAAVGGGGVIQRAAYFAPLQGSEKKAYWVYAISNVAILLYLCFLKIKLAPPALFYTGAALYVLGNVLLALSVVGFAAPSVGGVNRKGIYRLSRNPMYVAYFVLFLGCALLVQSWLLLVLVLVFQVSTHWIILSEERWCLAQFGKEYQQYMENVRRYL